MPEVDEVVDFPLNEKDIEIDFYAASSAG